MGQRESLHRLDFIHIGPELNQLTGIAAILTFPLDIEIVEAEEREALEAAQREVEPDG